VPAPNGATLDVTLTVAGVVPLVGETDSHDPPDGTAVNVALGESEMVRLCAAGELPPTVAEKDNELGLTEIDWAVLTVSVTGIEALPALLLMLSAP
jgi:hypothetical protein